MKKGYNFAFGIKALKKLKEKYKKDFTEIFAEELNKDSELHSIRIPGGTVSFITDISAKDDGNEKTNTYSLVPNPENNLYEYARLISMVNKPINTIVCLNIYRLCSLPNFMEGTENCLLYLKEAIRVLGVNNIYAIELGNELYLHKTCTGILGNLTDKNRKSFNKAMEKYTLICNYLIPEIKKLSPKSIICVPVENCMSERGNEWNKGVTKIEGVTGICPHFYCDSVKNVEEKFILKTSIKIKEDNKIIFKSLQPQFKVLVTEYNFMFGTFGDKNQEIFNTDLHHEVINRIKSLGIDMKFDVGCFHYLLQDNIDKPYGQFIIQDDKIIKRLNI